MLDCYFECIITWLPFFFGVVATITIMATLWTSPFHKRGNWELVEVNYPRSQHKQRVVESRLHRQSPESSNYFIAFNAPLCLSPCIPGPIHRKKWSLFWRCAVSGCSALLVSLSPAPLSLEIPSHFLPHFHFWLSSVGWFATVLYCLCPSQPPFLFFQFISSQFLGASGSGSS